jgi:hypothetical protein
MKKNSAKHNPLKFFNDSKAAGYKKANSAMKTFKKSLKKAQDGLPFKNTYEGPLTESDTKRLDQEFPSTAAPQVPYLPKKPFMGYGTEDQYRQIEKEDRAAFENYLRSPAMGPNYAKFKQGLNPNASLWGQTLNDKAQRIEMNRMNNIDWNSDEGKLYKKIYDRDTKYYSDRNRKKGGPVKRKKK